MSFIISFMQNNDPANKITKNPTAIVGESYEGQLVEGTSIIDPAILIQTSSVPTGNYAYIEAFHRYYFVRNIESVKNSLWKITLHVDPLKSFANEILSNTAVVARSTDTFNLYLNDPRYKAYADPLVLTRRFPYGFTTFQFVLALLGSYDTSV